MILKVSDKEDGICIGLDRHNSKAGCVAGKGQDRKTGKELR